MKIIDLQVYRLSALLELPYETLLGILIEHGLNSTSAQPIDYTAILNKCGDFINAKTYQKSFI